MCPQNCRKPILLVCARARKYSRPYAYSSSSDVTITFSGATDEDRLAILRFPQRPKHQQQHQVQHFPSSNSSSVHLLNSPLLLFAFEHSVPGQRKSDEILLLLLRILTLPPPRPPPPPHRPPGLVQNWSACLSDTPLGHLKFI